MELNEKSIKEEPSVEFLCILPAFEDTKRLNGMLMDIKTEKETIKTKNTKQCKICLRDFTTGYNLKRHLKTHDINFVLNSEGKKFKCNDCPKLFKSKRTQKQHQNIHNKFTCDLCGLQITTKTVLEDHIAFHLNPTEFACKVCGKQFNNRNGLRTHNNRNHPKIPRVFSCELCQKPFKCRNGLSLHRNQHKDRVNCPICSRLITVNSLKRHIKRHKSAIHPPKWKCKNCDKSFLSHYLLNVHMRSHVNIYQCDLCEKGARNKASLQSHMRDHFELNPHRCKHCNRGFKLKRVMEQHVARIHFTEDQKKFQCEICKTKFGMKNFLDNHRRNHRKKRAHNYYNLA